MPRSTSDTPTVTVEQAAPEAVSCDCRAVTLHPGGSQIKDGVLHLPAGSGSCYHLGFDGPGVKTADQPASFSALVSAAAHAQTFISEQLDEAIERRKAANLDVLRLRAELDRAERAYRALTAPPKTRGTA